MLNQLQTRDYHWIINHREGVNVDLSVLSIKFYEIKIETKWNEVYKDEY